MKRAKINMETIYAGSGILDQLENKHMSRTDRASLILENITTLKAYYKERVKIGFKEGEAVKYQGKLYQVESMWMRSGSSFSEVTIMVKVKSFDGNTFDAPYNEFTKV